MTIELEYHELLVRYRELNARLMTYAEKYQTEFRKFERELPNIVSSKEDRDNIQVILIEQVKLLNRMIQLKPHLNKTTPESSTTLH